MFSFDIIVLVQCSNWTDRGLMGFQKISGSLNYITLSYTVNIISLMLS